MKVRTERRIDTEEELVLDISVPTESMPELIEQCYMAIRSQRKIEQYPGESPKEACERALSKETADQLVCNAAMNMSYPFARSEVTDVSTVGSPLFAFPSEIRLDAPFTYTARWAKLPQAELSSYDPITITAPAKRASDSMVEEQIQQILQAHARFEPTDEVRPITSGDTVSLSLHTTIEGDAVEGLCFGERTYTTGIGAMPEEFEENVIGMQPGETKHFDFQGIADFDENEQPIMGSYTADVTLGKLQKQVKPLLSDAWVNAVVPGCKTVEEFYASIRSQLDEQLQGEYRHYLNYKAASELATRFSGRIPDVAYEAMRDELQDQFDQEAAAQGLTREEYMAQQGANEEQYSIRMVLQIRERLAQSIALDALARHLGMQVTEEDLAEFFKASAPAGAEGELRRQIEGSGRMYLAYEGALRLKANDYLVKNATIIEAS